MQTSGANTAQNNYTLRTATNTMNTLRNWFSGLNSQQALQVALSPQANAPLPPTVECRLLLEETIVVAVDSESWTYHTDLLTEIGLASIERKRSMPLRGMIGDWAQNLMRQMRFDHLAIIEHAHLFAASHKLGKNRFGTTRFFTLQGARDVLEAIFNSDVNSTDLRICQCKRPIVLIGHGLQHDTDNFMKPGLDFSIFKHGTVVRRVDTQQFAKELRAWVDPITPSNTVGLHKLCSEVFKFEHLDTHTAGNDAARTFMCAVLLAYGWHRPEVQKTAAAGMFMQDVANDVELHSRSYYSLKKGYQNCCTRCASLEHPVTQCSIKVHCAACERYDKVKTIGDAERDAEKEFECVITCTDHVEYYCVHIAEALAWKKRVMDAHHRGNPGTSTSWPNNHPASNYAGMQPTEPHEVAAYDPVPRIHPQLPVSLCPPFELRWASPTTLTRPSRQSMGFSAPDRGRRRLQVGRRSRKGAHSSSCHRSFGDEESAQCSSDDSHQAQFKRRRAGP